MRRAAAALGAVLTMTLAGAGHHLAAEAATPTGATPTSARAVVGAGDESRDFRFPGADLVRIPGTRSYVAYGASIRGNKLPYTRVEFRDGTFQRRGQVDGNAWADTTFPAGYWAERTSRLWTPAVFAHRDSDNRLVYYLFYSARKRDSSKYCIGYATSTSWRGGWRTKAAPLYCAQNAWAIDADVTRGGGGVWLTLRNGDWTRDRITALGAGRLRFDRPRHVTLSAPRKLLDNEHLEWTHHNSPAADVLTIENPNAVWMNQRWYLFYSGNNWYANRYATGVASCGADLADGPCQPIAEPRAYFAYKPDPDGAARFRPGLPADMRKKTLPGNKRGPGAFDAFQAPDGSWWASWNYITDASTLADPVRQSRIAPLARSGNGPAADFTVTWRR